MERPNRDFGRFSQEDLEEAVGYRMGSAPRVGFGESCALLIVDMDRSVVRRYAGCKAAVDHTAVLLAAAREAGIPIFFTRGGNLNAEITAAEQGIYALKTAQSFVGSRLSDDEYEIADEIRPVAGEVVITKLRSSAFLGTLLDQLLNWHRVDTLIITGMSTKGCVLATARDASASNYRVIVPEECCDIGSGPGSLHFISMLNIDRTMGDVVPLDTVLKHLERNPVRVTTAALAGRA